MGFFKKTNKTNEPERPANVPAEARWNEEENEWELGEYDEDGNMIGEWKWWLAPNGHLVCHTFFEDDGSEDMTFTRYHQDGTISQKGQYVDGVPQGEFFSQKSHNVTTEIYNPRGGFKAITTFENGYVVEEHYFDENDNEIGEPYIANK